MAKAYAVVTYRSISKPEALAAYKSTGCKEALRVLGTDTAVRDMRVVKGVD